MFLSLLSLLWDSYMVSVGFEERILQSVRCATAGFSLQVSWKPLRCRLFKNAKKTWGTTMFLWWGSGIWYFWDRADVFVLQTLNLPQEPKDSRSSSDSSTKGTEHLHRITPMTYITSKPLEPRQPTYDPIKGDKGEEGKCSEFSQRSCWYIHKSYA